MHNLSRLVFKVGLLKRTRGLVKKDHKISKKEEAKGEEVKNV